MMLAGDLAGHVVDGGPLKDIAVRRVCFIVAVLHGRRHFSFQVRQFWLIFAASSLGRR
jgi:hypothetical protein